LVVKRAVFILKHSRHQAADFRFKYVNRDLVAVSPLCSAQTGACFSRNCAVELRWIDWRDASLAIEQPQDVRTLKKMLQIESRTPTGVCTGKSHLDVAAGSLSGFRLSVAVHSYVARWPFLSPVVGVLLPMWMMVSAMPLLYRGTLQKFSSTFGVSLVSANEVHGDMYRADHEALLRERN
jgi:hypothetical protein